MPKDIKDRLIFALDVNTQDDAKAWIDRLKPYVGCFKIGLELFVSSGPRFVEEIAKDQSVFLDLKLHDIPQTIFRTMKKIDGLGVDFVTVHAGLDHKGLSAAVDAVSRTNVLAVSVLTSVDDITPITLSIEELVEIRAQRAAASGCYGLILSAHELSRLKNIKEDLEFITPGIRLESSKKADQSRIMTPKEAIEKGAERIVVGRPIRDADDPIRAAKHILAQIEEGLNTLQY